MYYGNILTEVDFPLENLCCTLAILHNARTTLGVEYHVNVITDSLPDVDGGFFDPICSIINPELVVCFNWE